MNIHSQARTTPKIREEIRASKGHMTIKEAAHHFNVNRGTIIKWRKRESFQDKSHRPNTLHTALSPIQEEIVVVLRRNLLLTIDDLLVVVREFIDDTASRYQKYFFSKKSRVLSRLTLVAEPATSQ